MALNGTRVFILPFPLLPLNAFDRQFQPGSPFLIALFAAAALLFVGLAVVEPEHRDFAPLPVALALAGVWKNYEARSGWAVARSEREA